MCNGIFPISAPRRAARAGMVLGLAVLAAAGASPAVADDKDWEDCSQFQEVNRTIVGCSAVLDRGEAETPLRRTRAFAARGVVYFERGDVDRSIGNYDQAILLSPSEALLFLLRGRSWEKKGERELAVADYGHAVRIDGNEEAQKALERLQVTTGRAATITTIPIPASDNYADERTDFGVRPQNVLKREVGAQTPSRIPGATILTTRQLAEKLRGRERLLLLDVWADATHQLIPGARRLAFAGMAGDFHDDIQNLLGRSLKQLTDGKQDHPLIFYCAGAECWESYNAALRATALGYEEVYWYRGGFSSWRAANLPLIDSN